MADKTQINVRLNTDQKDRWEDYVDRNPEYSSVSQLVRQAVTAEIEGYHDDRGDVNLDPIEGRIEAMSEELDGLRTDLAEVSEAVKSVAGAIDTGGDTSLRRTRAEAYAALPVGEEDAMTISELRDDLGDGYSEAVVGHAVDDLAENSGSVHEQWTPDGPTRYYRSE